MRTLLALLCVLLFGGSAYAQAPMGSPLTGFYPGFRTGLRFVSAGAGLSGDCGKTPPPGLVQTFCADFYNGSYTNNGTTPSASFTAAGGTLPSGCTITTSTGLQCSTTSASIPSTNTSVSYLVENSVASVSTATAVTPAFYGAVGTELAAGVRLSGAGFSATVGGTSSNVVGANLGAADQVAVCQASSTSGFASVAGGTSQAITSTALISENTTLYVAGSSTSTQLVTSTVGAVRSVRLFTGTCSSANVVLASAN